VSLAAAYFSKWAELPLYVITYNLYGYTTFAAVAESDDDDDDGDYHSLAKTNSCLMPNTHRRRRRDETVELRRVGVGGVNTIHN